MDKRTNPIGFLHDYLYIDKGVFSDACSRDQISRNLNKLDFFSSLNIKIVEVDGLELVLQLRVFVSDPAGFSFFAPASLI